jgi:hypothetical protein
MLTLNAMCGCVKTAGSDDLEEGNMAVSTMILEDVQTAADTGQTFGLPFDVAQPHRVTRSYCPVYDATKDACASHLDYRFHDDRYAIDFAGGSGLRVLATATGTVSMAMFDPGYGYTVEIDHEGGYVTKYGHMRERPLVNFGDQVVAGQQLGFEGTTGKSTGPHIHFALYKERLEKGVRVALDAVKPEPLGGYTDFGTAINAATDGQPTIGKRRYRMPVGTVVKFSGSADVFRVCAAGKLCRVAEWDVFKRNRLFYNQARPSDQIVELKADEAGCYTRSSEITDTTSLAYVSCGSKEYVVLRDGAYRVRRPVPFSAFDARRKPLLKSWGFDGQEVVTGDALDCTTYPATTDGPDLTVRPGTVLEEASDNDFFLVTTESLEGTARAGFVATDKVTRLPRESSANGVTAQLVYELYHGFRQVIQIPTGAVEAMTGTANRSSYGAANLTNMQGCVLVAVISGTGGDSDTETVITTPVDACVQSMSRCGSDPAVYEHCLRDYSNNTVGPTSWEKFPCPTGQVCTGQGQCASKPVDPTLSAAETSFASVADPAHTIRCAAQLDGTLKLTVTGPFLDGALMANPADPYALMYGADGIGWGVPYVVGRSQTAWLGDASAHVLTLPAAATRFNLYVADRASAASESWLKLAPNVGSPWKSMGQCRIDGGVIVRDDSLTSTTVTPAPVTTTAVTVADAPHTIRCAEQADESVVVTVTGPFLDGALMANPADSYALMFGADGVGWGVPYASGRAQTAWLGDSSAHTLTLPAAATRFNLYVADRADAARDSWLKLAPNDGSPWTVTGDCIIGYGVIERK